MQLHVLGPAYGLPSIDPECLACIALLQLKATEGGWTLVPTHDLQRSLPSLTYNDETIRGFKDIAKHIEEKGNGTTITLKQEQRANATAITSFVESNAQVLLDVSIYVSFENYARTRSAFTKILPWYANYIIPPRRRAEARRRTEHLGISSIDVDDVHEDLSNRPSTLQEVGKEAKFETDTKQRASLLLPKRSTVRSFLRRPEYSAVFKLQALADNFFGPLEDMLGEESYFLGTGEPETVDCVVYAYLALMLYPPLPQDWLASTMRRKYPKLSRFTERMHEKLKMQTDVEQVLVLTRHKHKPNSSTEAEVTSSTTHLPWHPPPPSTILSITTSLTFDLLPRLPIIGPSRTTLIHSKPHPTPFWQNKAFPALLAATATSLTFLGYFAFATGVLTWPRGEAVQIFGRRRLSDYGDLGAALAGGGVWGQYQQQQQQEPVNDDVVFHPRDLGDRPVRVEVEVEKDELP